MLLLVVLDNPMSGLCTAAVDGPYVDSRTFNGEGGRRRHQNRNRLMNIKSQRVSRVSNLLNPHYDNVSPQDHCGNSCWRDRNYVPCPAARHPFLELPTTAVSQRKRDRQLNFPAALPDRNYS